MFNEKWFQILGSLLMSLVPKSDYKLVTILYDNFLFSLLNAKAIVLIHNEIIDEVTVWNFCGC